MLKRIKAVLRTTGNETVSQTIQYVEAPIGEPVSLEVELRNDADVPVNLTGNLLRFRLYDHHGIKLYETTKTVTTGGTQGVTTIAVTVPTLRPKAYGWDLWYEAGGSKYQIVPISVWKASSTY